MKPNGNESYICWKKSGGDERFMINQEGCRYKTAELVPGDTTTSEDCKTMFSLLQVYKCRDNFDTSHGILRREGLKHGGGGSLIYIRYERRWELGQHTRYEQN